jgi:hypothetical protein
VSLFSGRCPCCGDSQPCEYDARFPLNREYDRLLREGASIASATSSVLDRIRKNHLRECGHCHRWMLANNTTVRTICDECKAHRKVAKSGIRTRRRTNSGADADRKRTEREIQNRRVPKPPQLNRAISRAMRQHGRAPVTAEHCQTALKDPKYRRNTLHFLKVHAAELEKDLRAFLAANRDKRPTA